MYITKSHPKVGYDFQMILDLSESEVSKIARAINGKKGLEGLHMYLEMELNQREEAALLKIKTDVFNTCYKYDKNIVASHYDEAIKLYNDGLIHKDEILPQVVGSLQS